ncbi:MAG: putative hydrolase [Archaeoglobi archaeon]|nr:histidinol phosphate phosphatase domain-containing protein [Candidatus Mnemosynella bozhongmuii]MDI3502091.1 putative hydrolase [Archaeoglobi archaeon]MDK2782332.1 putative hydrolase [Archaeoglobi archaeon]
MYDLHTHSIFSDGILLPSELIRTAEYLGYKGVAITDHVDFSNIERVVEGLRKLEEEEWNIDVVIGVEITHVSPVKMGRLVQKARDLGVEYIVVHGETIVEPVEEGTNLAAIKEGVPLLAHPGLISEEEVELASENGVFLEITSRRGHSLTNGHVARLSIERGAGLLLNSDLHEPEDFMSREMREKIALGSGVPDDCLKDLLEKNPRKIVEEFKI